MAIKVYSPIDFEDTSSGLSIDGDFAVDTNTLFVDVSTDRVGIGTSSPAYKLHVTGDAILAGASKLYLRDSLTYITESSGLILDSGHSTRATKFLIGGSEKLRIHTNGYVGIGTTSPSSRLNVVGDQAIFSGSAGTANLGIQVKGTALSAIPSAQTQGYIGTGDSSIGVAGDLLIAPRTSAVANIRFITGTSPEERMRIDSAGNLLVAKTAPNVANVGFESKSDGAHFMTRDGGEPLKINRLTNDGNLIAFARSGSTVGSIGSYGGSYIGIGTSDVGLLFNVGGQSIIPHNMSTNLVRDNAIDLGQNGIRWKDLWLSGGVVFGATGGSVISKTLDDYEEGSWTPACTSGTLSFNGGSYTKIGNTVTIRTNVYAFSDNTSSSPVQITGIPFTGSAGVTATGAIIGQNIASTRGYNAYIPPNGTVIYFYEPPNAGAYETMRYSDLSSGSDIHVTITYQTNS